MSATVKAVFRVHHGERVVQLIVPLYPRAPKSAEDQASDVLEQLRRAYERKYHNSGFENVALERLCDEQDLREASSVTEAVELI